MKEETKNSLYSAIQEGGVIEFIDSHFVERSVVEKAIVDEILICHHENTPTSRLTSLVMKLSLKKSLLEKK